MTQAAQANEEAKRKSAQLQACAWRCALACGLLICVCLVFRYICYLLSHFHAGWWLVFDQQLPQESEGSMRARVRACRPLLCSSRARA